MVSFSFTRRNEIVDFLEEKRKEKFKEEDFNNTTGFSYVPDASAEFGLSLEEKVSVSLCMQTSACWSIMVMQLGLEPISSSK